MTATAADLTRPAEQHLLELKRALGRAMTSLADMKQMIGRTRSQVEAKTKLSQEREREAIRALERMKSGELDRTEAEAAATEALTEKVALEVEAKALSAELDKQETLAGKLQEDVTRVQNAVRQLEGEILTLKARARAAQAAVRAGETMAAFNPAEAEDRLARTRRLVEEQEALAEAYGQMAEGRTSLDQEIDAALGENPSAKADESLAKMKKEMGLK